MKLSLDMLFAHPVLSPVSGDFHDAFFDSDFSITLGDENLDVLAVVHLRCDDLAALLKSGGAGAGFFLTCHQTYENRLVEMAPGTKEHRFRASDFFGTVRLRPVVWSKEPRRGWKCGSLHPEYGGVASFPASAILAVGDEQRFTVDRERLKPFESIFSLSAIDSVEQGEIALDTDADKISIKVHPTTKASIEGIRNNISGRNVLLSAVYLPAVMQVLGEVSADRSRCEDRKWFRIFEAKAVAKGVNLEQPDVLRDAQRLLGIPFSKIEAEKERLFA